MKNFSIVLLLAFSLYSCDKWYNVSYSIKNESNSDVIVKYSDPNSTYIDTVKTNQEKLILVREGLHSVGMDCQSKKDPEIKYLTIEEISNLSNKEFKRDLSTCDLWQITEAKSKGNYDEISYNLIVTDTDF